MKFNEKFDGLNGKDNSDACQEHEVEDRII